MYLEAVLLGLKVVVRIRRDMSLVEPGTYRKPIFSGKILQSRAYEIYKPVLIGNYT